MRNGIFGVDLSIRNVFDNLPGLLFLLVLFGIGVWIINRIMPIVKKRILKSGKDERKVNYLCFLLDTTLITVLTLVLLGVNTSSLIAIFCGVVVGRRNRYFGSLNG